MRTIVCSAPGKLELAERPLPVAGPGEIAVDIRAVGVCGTDFHIFQGKHPFLQYPRVMGHELSGVVADNSGSRNLPAGTPVIVNPYLSCGTCIACRKGRFNCCTRIRVLGVHIDGGMAERIVMLEGNLYPAGSLSLRDGAMVEFLAIGAHAVARSEIEKGMRTLVVGMGPIGIGTATFAADSGAEVTVMDVSPARLAWVRDNLGFKNTILAGPEARAEAEAATGGDYYERVFDATGNARAMGASFGFVAHTGTLVFVGLIAADITFADAEFHKREMKLVATRNALRADFERVMAAMAAGRINTDAINTDTAPLAELPAAMPAWLAAETLPVKAILTL